jgi:hypothetical protein
MQFGKAKVGVAYSHLKYSLGREFESLRANGTADIATRPGGGTRVTLRVPRRSEAAHG